MIYLKNIFRRLACTKKYQRHKMESGNVTGFLQKFLDLAKLAEIWSTEIRRHRRIEVDQIMASACLTEIWLAEFQWQLPDFNNHRWNPPMPPDSGNRIPKYGDLRQ
jgi:hypothetical protein